MSHKRVRARGERDELDDMVERLKVVARLDAAPTLKAEDALGIVNDRLLGLDPISRTWYMVGALTIVTLAGYMTGDERLAFFTALFKRGSGPFPREEAVK